MLGQKMYVVTDANLMQAVQRQPKVLNFLPIEAKAASRICAVSAESVNKLYGNPNEEDGETAILKEIQAARRAALSPGPAFDELNQHLVQNLQDSLVSIRLSAGQPTRIGLSTWLRRNVTAASTKALYGLRNPFVDESVANGIWQLNKNLTPLLVDIFTSITASQGLAGRSVVTKAFEEYFRNGGHETASVAVKTRHDISVMHGIPEEDIAKLEVGEAIATLTNTAPACFWALFFIYSTAGLLEELRASLDSKFANCSDGAPRPDHKFDIGSIKEDRPLLVSIVSETLRYCSLGGSVRDVKEDTILDHRWLLKKGGIVQMPSRILHKDASAWGGTVDAFDPKRFLSDESKPRSTANFRPFGGGTTLCPGRHLATNTILAVAALFVMHYDLLPVSGAWSMPSVNNTGISEFMMEPDQDIEVDVVARQSFEENEAC
ncbi:hypothetical protein ACLMJK_009462 [Lecanora helva]